MAQLVILAGGLGTRLRERLQGLPKPLIAVGEVPLLETQICLAKRYGFKRVLILVNYKADAIVEFCRSKGNWGIDIQCINDGLPLGTAGAVLRVFDQLEDEFLLMYGDTMLEVDLERFHRFHVADKCSAATLFLHPNDHPQDSDLVEMNEGGYVVGIYPYPHKQDRYYPNLVNAGLYWIRKSALAPWREHSSGVLDFGKQLFPKMIENGIMFRGYNSPEYIKDCGTPERIDKVNVDFHSGKIARSGLSCPQAGVFLDRDGTLNQEVGHLNSSAQFELYPGVGHAIRRLNQSEFRVCVVTNQPVLARGECSNDSMRQIHNKMETLLGRCGAFVDRIYYCPHHPQKGYFGEVETLKKACDCRKPNTGMIKTAIDELNVALQRSWLIGDTTVDLQTARNAGLRSILVETGYAGLDEKYWATPDFVVPDLEAAVSHILDIYPKAYELIEPLTSEIPLGAVVFIGGQSRAGKSTFASVMRDVLEAHDLRCHVISTDRWLKSEAERGVGVLGRHWANSLEDVVNILTNSRSKTAYLSLPGYSKSRREHTPNVEILEILPNDVVLLEGIVALYFANNIGAQNQFVVEIDENIRRQRVIGSYLVRGFRQETAEAVYLERLDEEVPWVASTANRAVSVLIPSAATRKRCGNDY